MMDLKALVMAFVGSLFVNNFILTRFMGLCPFLGVSRRTGPALCMGLAVLFVMTASSVITWMLYAWLLVPLDLLYLRTLLFILVIAAFVQAVDMVLLKLAPALHRVLGIYLPLITTNCAVLGVTVLNVDMFFTPAGAPVAGSFWLSAVQGFSGGLGFTLALLLMSGIRERLDLLDVPRPFRGLPIAFVVASLMSMAFLGFSGFNP